MKKRNALFAWATVALFVAASCFQDLGQDPPFNYPDGLDGLENLGAQGEVFYMPFETAGFVESLSETEATPTGTPVIAAGKIGQAYKGAADSYLSFNLADLATPVTKQFSAAFWYKIGAAGRAGIITCGEKPDNRKVGFRFMREGSATKQTFKLSLGIGDSDPWVDGGDAASLDPTVATGWIHMAFTIDENRAAVYIDGKLVKEITLAKAISWSGCTAISIGSGAPTFTEWNHLSEDGQIDELRFFNKTITQEQVTALMNLNQ